MIKRFTLSVLLWVLVSCQALAPATYRPIPDLPRDFLITLDDRHYETASFRLRYPSGWEVVKSNPSFGAPEVYFIAPDETMEIFVFLIARPAPDIPDDIFYLEAQQTFDDGSIVFVRGTSIPEKEAELTQTVKRVVVSITQPDKARN